MRPAPGATKGRGRADHQGHADRDGDARRRAGRRLHLDPAGRGPGAASTIAGTPPSWTPPERYAFTLQRQCGGGPSLGRYRVTVADGQVVTADRIDGKTAQGEEEIEVPTLDGLLTLARTAADDGGAVSTTLDPKDGHPTAVTFDTSNDGQNEGQACFQVTDYAPGA